MTGVGEFIKQVPTWATIGALSVASAVGYNIYDNNKWLQCAVHHIAQGSNFFVCSQSKAEAQAPQFGDFSNLGEKPTDYKVRFTWGDGQVTVQGEGKLDYIKDPTLLEQAVSVLSPGYDIIMGTNPIPHVDATLFLKKVPVTLTYEPSTTIMNDLKNALTPDTTTDQIPGSAPLPPSDTGDLKISLVPNPTNPLAKPVVNVDAGVFQPSFMRIDNTPENSLRWSHKGDANVGYERTFLWLGDKLITDYATTVSCSSGWVNVDAAKQVIANYTRGSLASKPATRYLQDAQINVTLNDPPAVAAAQQARIDAFNKELASFNSMKQSIKDSAGNTQPMLPPKFGNFSFDTSKCTAATQASLQQVQAAK